MIKLPSDFELDRYGLHVRLVREEDAEFIVKLRTDPHNARFIHDTDPSIQNQIEWIRGYKQREAAGTEYYFIYAYNNESIGLYRLYKIHDDVFTSGSWVFVKGCDAAYPILAPIIALEIAFETLGLNYLDAFDGCHVDNKKVDKINRLLGLKENGRIHDVKGEYITYSMTKEEFYPARQNVLKLLGY